MSCNSSWSKAYLLKEEEKHHQYLCGVRNTPEQLSYDLIRGYWLILTINNNFHTKFLIYISVYIYSSDLNMVTYNTIQYALYFYYKSAQHDSTWHYMSQNYYMLSWIIQKYLAVPIFGKSDYQWLKAWEEKHLRYGRKWNDSAGGGGQQQKARHLENCSRWVPAHFTSFLKHREDNAVAEHTASERQ